MHSDWSRMALHVTIIALHEVIIAKMLDFKTAALFRTSYSVNIVEKSP